MEFPSTTLALPGNPSNPSGNIISPLRISPSASRNLISPRLNTPDCFRYLMYLHFVSHSMLCILLYGIPSTRYKETASEKSFLQATSNRPPSIYPANIIILSALGYFRVNTALSKYSSGAMLSIESSLITTGLDIETRLPLSYMQGY